MDEKRESFPNVSLKGKRLIQKGDGDSGEMRYGGHNAENKKKQK
ncbi:hypothetical protein [Neobacillus terrae]|nr:hypothetical protein [Neobacillus terrae]